MFKTYMINKAVGWLVGGSFFTQIKGIVATLAGEDKTGDQKRASAIKQAKTLAGDTASFLINLAIEAAVVILKSKASK